MSGIIADPNANSGIKPAGLRPVAILKKDNYRASSTKLKVQLKVMDCWELVTGAELQPPATSTARADAAPVTADLALRKSWDRRNNAFLFLSLQFQMRSFIHYMDWTTFLCRFGSDYVRNLIAARKPKGR